MADTGFGLGYHFSSNPGTSFSFTHESKPSSTNHSFYGIPNSSSASLFSTTNASVLPSLFGAAHSTASGGGAFFGAAFSSSTNPSFNVFSLSTSASAASPFSSSNASASPSSFVAARSAASCGSPPFGATFSRPFTPLSNDRFSHAATSCAASTPSIFLGPSSTATATSTSSKPFFSSAASSAPLFGTPDEALCFGGLTCNLSRSFAAPAAMSSTKTTVAPSTFGATCASAAMTTSSPAAQFNFSGALFTSSAQASSTTTAAVVGKSGGSATTTIIPSVCAPQMPSEIRGKTIEEAYDGDSVDVAAVDGSEATALKAVPFQLMQRDETSSCKGDPVSVEEWRTLVETTSTVVLDGGTDMRERVAEMSGRHFDVFSPMVDLSLRCQEFCNRYEEERQRREKLDAGILEHSKEVYTLQNEIEQLQMAAAKQERLRYEEERQRRKELDAGSLEHSKEVHMLRNEIERLQMAAAERERMPPLGEWWGIWQREARRADDEKKRADEERQLVKELTAELREAERKLGYYKNKYYGLSSLGTTTRGDSSDSREHFSEHMEDPREGRD